ncbi:hypothetical protein AB1E18_004192 [Capra hircus]
MGREGGDYNDPRRGGRQGFLSCPARAERRCSPGGQQGHGARRAGEDAGRRLPGSRDPPPPALPGSRSARRLRSRGRKRGPRPEGRGGGGARPSLRSRDREEGPPRPGESGRGRAAPHRRRLLPALRGHPRTRRARAGAGGERAELAGAPAAPGPPAMSADEMVQIRLEDRCYPVSKRKLIEQSDYFRALYRSGMREALSPEAGGPEVQQLRGLSAPGLRLVLDFINAGGAREGWLLGRRGEPGGGAEEEEEDMDEASLLSELVEAASFLQVTSLLQLLLSQVRLTNCLELYRLAQVYGLPDLQEACLRFMAVHFHEVLCKPQFHLLGSSPPAPGDVSLKQRLREARMTGTPVLVALGDFLGGPLAPHPYQGEPPSMLRYEEMTERWFPLANNLPPDLVNVRGYGAAILDNYLFIVGGYRITSQEISAAHSYNPSTNEWLQVASMNQKRSNFKLVAVNFKLYAIGGQAVSNVECYNPEQDAWNFVAPLPNPLAEFSACECKGKIYVIGGYTTRDRNLNILQYCPSADLWTLFETCDVHIRKQQMVSVEETIYIVGGCLHELGPTRRGSQSEDMLTVQSYNTATRQWLYLKENTSKSGLNLTCALHNDGIYIMSRDVTLSTSLEHRVFLKYNIFSDSWEAFRRFPAFGHNLLVSSLYLPNKTET